MQLVKIVKQTKEYKFSMFLEQNKTGIIAATLVTTDEGWVFWNRNLDSVAFICFMANSLAIARTMSRNTVTLLSLYTQAYIQYYPI